QIKSERKLEFAKQDVALIRQYAERAASFAQLLAGYWQTMKLRDQETAEKVFKKMNEHWDELYELDASVAALIHSLQSEDALKLYEQLSESITRLRMMAASLLEELLKLCIF